MHVPLKNLVFHVFKLYINGMILFVPHYTIYHNVGDSSMLCVVILRSFSVLVSVPIYGCYSQFIVYFPVDEL